MNSLFNRVPKFYPAPLLVLLSLLLAGVDLMAAVEDEILDRYEQIILLESAPSVSQGMGFAQSLSEEGRWPDLDYDSTSVSGWDPDTHLKRVRLMALALEASNIRDTQKPPIMLAIDRAVQDWANHMYQSDNWWFNEIGSPQLARDTLVLLRENASQATRQTLLDIMAQHKIAGTATNLAWSAEIAFHYACFTDNRELLATAADRVWQEVTVGAAEGIQIDGSFYQHEERLMTWGYGRSFLDIMSKLAWQLRGTEWEMPAEKRSIIDSYILDGAQWMQRDGFNSPSGLDRAVTRQRHMDEANMRSILTLWRDVSSARAGEIQALIDRQNGFGDPLVGMRVFPLGDFAAYQRPTAAILLKTVSDRTLLTQSINGENLLGVPYLTCGDHYILSNGREYFDLPPVWNWNKLPGLTTPDGDSEPIRRPFTGGVTDGESGLFTMDYARERDEDTFEVRKMWAFHRGMMVCLLGGWTLNGAWDDLSTSLDQCLVQGPIEYSINGSRTTIAEEDTEISGAEWVLHNGIGYIPLNPEELLLRSGLQEGSWQRINESGSPDQVSLRVLNLQIRHGGAPASSGYIIVTKASPEILDEIVEDLPVVLANERSLQAIEFRDGVRMAAFFEAGGVGEGDTGGPALNVDQPSIALWSRTGAWLADPTHVGGEIVVTLDGVAQTLTLPEQGFSATTVEDWQGYSVLANGAVDTLGWVGWLNIAYDPWVWSYTLGRWVFVGDEGFLEEGIWGYVVR